ncbi:SMC-Scp complex subunit ScpB [Corticicoccus populi]|uniref:SMC-Scp complex subunit ScpB n=1 Tax=Corticicoccus populi TaxID=1812821 RepID=A0ABW5WTP1_9STAP
MEKIDIIEGLLYVAGDLGLNEKQLIEHVPITREQLYNEVEKFNKPHLLISYHDDMFYLTTSKSMEKYINRLLSDKPKGRLSQASLEVLSIIAYNQPVSRSDVEELRGIASDGPVSTLVNKGLIKKTQVEDERANYFVTTEHFLQVFGLKTINDLPEQEDEKEQEEMELFFNSLQTEEKND